MARSPDRRPGFSRRAQYSLFLSYVLAIAGVVVGAALLALSHFDPAAFGVLRSGAAEATAPISSALGGATRWVTDVPNAIGSFFGVRQENARMHRELVSANRLLQRARALHHENQRLRRLLQLRDAEGDAVTSARLVSSSAGSTRRFGLLNAGLWQGVREGQPVEAPDGLVGRVVETGPDTARVLLLIDPESVVPVQRARDGLPAIVAGRGDGTVAVRGVNAAIGDIRVGDLFVTSGAGGIFAPGTPVARVMMRASDGGIGQPLADPDGFDFVTVRHAFLPAPPPPRRTLP